MKEWISGFTDSKDWWSLEKEVQCKSLGKKKVCHSKSHFSLILDFFVSQIFDELDEVIKGSDKIDPALLLSSATDFMTLDISDTTLSQDTSDIKTLTTERELTTHRNERIHNPKKHSTTNTNDLTSF